MTQTDRRHQKDVQARFARLDGLLGAVARIAAPDTRATVNELLQTLLELHGAGLEHLLEALYDAPQGGQALVDEVARDPLVGQLLLLHGLHPLDLPARVSQALDEVRPYMHSHGGDVELLGVSPEGAVRLRLVGSCDGCPSSQVTMKYAVEEAVYSAAPDVVSIEVDGVAETRPAAPSGFIPLAQILPETEAAH